jgi:hypothetical protein
MSCTILPKPSFEVGKHYRTREGWIVKLRELVAGSVYPLGGMFDRIIGNHWWRSNGRWLHYTDAEHKRDLMPGAIEDEPVAVEGTMTPEQFDIDMLMRAVDRQRSEIAAQTNVIAGMAAKIEAHECTIANLNRQSQGHSRITATLGQRVEEHSDRLDRLAIELGGKVNALLSAESMRDACTAAADRAKRTIKGGWVNVWQNPRGFVLSAFPHQTKASAHDEAVNDTGVRIACILIPDITEGQGL